MSGKFGEILYNISIGANQSIRRNTADNGWEAFTPSAGGGGVWGAITGTLSDQTDLQSALDGKQAILVSATNIKTINGSTILGAGDLAVSGGLTQQQVEGII